MRTVTASPALVENPTYAPTWLPSRDVRVRLDLRRLIFGRALPAGIFGILPTCRGA